jgi:hypothetical protein
MFLPFPKTATPSLFLKQIQQIKKEFSDTLLEKSICPVVLNQNLNRSVFRSHQRL